MPIQATSPDGTRVAFVRNYPDIDPPSQSIWVNDRGKDAQLIKRLGPDSDWCNTIVWSPDSSTVAFLIQDARLITVDAASLRIVSDQWLTSWKGEYPPHDMVTELTLDAPGLAARFRICDRGMWRPYYRFDAIGCGNFLTARVKDPNQKVSF